MRNKDRTYSDCLDLAMAATAYGQHRGNENGKKLVAAISNIHPRLPHVSILSPDITSIEQTIRSALSCGRAAGLSWQEMRLIFNEETEKVPPSLIDAVSDFERTVRGSMLQ